MESLSAEQYLKASRKETHTCKKISNNLKEPESYIPAVDFIHDDIIIPPNLKPNPEWSNNLKQWFAYVRHHVNSFEFDLEKKESYQTIIQHIENGDLPTVDSIKSLNDVSGILFYFHKKQSKKFSQNDLFWIFGALTRVDKLMLPEMCECIQGISETVRKQIVDGGGQNDKLFPYLSVINDLIVSYFHQF